MPDLRFRAAAVWLGVIVCLLRGSAWSSQLKVQEATLYVGAPADVKATAAADGESITFDLPKQVIPDSVQVTQADAPISAALDPVYVAGRDSSRPELGGYRCQLTGLRSGVSIEARFRTGGLGWKPSSILTVNGDRAKIAVQASILNQALDLTGARLRLMSGYVGGTEGFPSMAMADPADYETFTLAMREYASGLGAADAGGLHLLVELTDIQLAVGGTRQVPLVSGEIPVTRSYRWDTQLDSDSYYSDYRPPQRVSGLYTIENTTATTLPEGKVTISEGAMLVGSGYMGWTPPGHKGIVAVSSVQGLAVRRDDESEPNPKAWETRRTINLRVENSRDEKVTVSITERLLDWSPYDFESKRKVAYEFSRPPREGKPGTFQWDLTVPPHGQQTITYSFGQPVDVSRLRILSFTADDSPNEQAYLTEAPHTNVRLNSKGNPFREIQPDGYIVYRLPIPTGVAGAELAVWMGNAFRASIAPEANGKAGSYRVVADGIAIAGRAVRDGASNYVEYRFDLTPYLSENSRAVYFRLEDPTLTNTKGGAFIRMVEVRRVPEGFPSRAPAYATEQSTSEMPTAPRKLLASFDVFTEQEKPFIYQDTKTWVQEGVWPDRVRVADADQRIIYAFTIPPDVIAADCTIRVGNQFVIALARDDGGRPGEFREEINSISLLGRKPFFGENYRDWVFELTPFLRANAARRVYVALYDADPTDGWGAAIARVQVAVLDDAEGGRLARARRSQEEFARAQRGNFEIPASGSKEEVALVYDADGSRPAGLSRVLDGSHYVIYRFPATREDAGQSWFVSVSGDFVISLAPEEKGRPGEFVIVARARYLSEAEKVAVRGNRTRKVIDITERMIVAGGCYVKITDADPDESPSAVVMSIGKIPRS